VNVDIAVRALSGVLMIALPLGAAAVLTRRWQLGWRLVLFGGLTFVASQIGHIPFNLRVLNPWLISAGVDLAAPAGPGLVIAAVAFGLSAGVFEELARWFCYRFVIRSARTWREGVLLGVGHGGLEALFVGLSAVATLLRLLAIQGQDLAGIVPPEQLDLARAQVEAYWALPGWASLFAFVERVSAFVVQLSLSVLVLQVFLRPGRGLWLLAAIGWHALVDAVAVYVGVTSGVQTGSIGGMALTEVVIGLLALASLLVLLRLKPPKPAPPPPPPAPHRGPVVDAAPTQERLEESRFEGSGD
jgi:uncharacterized membrane protein YhfC